MIVQIVNAIKQWRVDPDGFLRVTACILKEGVYPYKKTEMGDPSETSSIRADADGTVWQYIPADAFTDEALKTLEGKPIIVGNHDWQTSTDAHPIGSVAGGTLDQPSKDEIVIDMLITDEDTKNKVMTRELQEVSAAYESDFEICDGVFNGTPYNGKQGNLRFNHILLLPNGCGRCGHDVRILNSKNNGNQGSLKMKNVIKLKLKNGVDKEYEFENEDDAEIAEKMVEDEKALNAEELATAMETIKSLNEKLEELQNEKDEALKTLNEAKAQIEELTSAEGQAELANAALEQDEDEDEILNSEFDTDEERTEIKNRCRNSKTYADRRKAIVMAVMNSKGKNVSGWNQESIDGAFEAMRTVARVRNSKAMGGVKAKNSRISGRDNLSRILRPLKA